MNLRNRIKEFRNVPTAELRQNSKNWRTHPSNQVKALDDLLKSVGVAGALTAYYSARDNGALVLIDGHARLDTAQAEWPVLILDVNDAEADLLLASLDPIAAMAGHDADKINDLLDSLEPQGAGLTELLESLHVETAAAAKVKPLPSERFPETVWVLIGINFNEFGECRDLLKQLKAHATIEVNSTSGEVPE